MGRVESGVITSLICQGCLTIEEFAEMTINAACTDIGITRDGHILTRPKRVTAQ
ncbi:MAG: hypothetical protein ACLP9Y_05245 [Mycobacterium sp.]